MKAVVYESELGRSIIMVPLAIADSMQPMERLKTVGYRKAICKGIQTMSYQKATDLFNSYYHRTGTPMELSKGTYTEDIEQEGRSIRLVKVETARKILIERGFDPVTTRYVGGEHPEEYRNHLCEFITINSEEINEQITPGWLDENIASEESIYSLPDLDMFQPKKKRRGRRIEVDSEKKESTCIRYLKWYNQQTTRKTRGIIHSWRLEKSSIDIVYVSIDIVFVDKQAETRQGQKENIPPQETEEQSQKTEGKKTESKIDDDDENNKRIGHVNIRIEHANKRYLITSIDIDEAYRELVAFLIYTKLCTKYIIFFIDGEQALVDRIEVFFKDRWEYDVYLDWMHLQEKVYDRMSNIIKPGKVPDPRGKVEYYKIKSKAGQIKKQDMIAQSQLYARELLRILWVGNIQEAIDYLENVDSELVNHPKEKERLLTYLKNKKGWITCYALRKKAGLRNSSNGVEGENRLLVADRQKHNGTSWCPDGSSNVATITCLFQNQEEDEWFYENRIRFCMPE